MADLWLIWGQDSTPRVYLRQNARFWRLWRGLLLARNHWIHRHVAARNPDSDDDDDEEVNSTTS
jgi:hypothetical protein